ncbi:GNAT family N-acetyltransferase [Nonomuraea sp. NPDC049714]|uniref:GNAT family N-acetyltransferase n=1 Tax=Nonomuraea sp. NPDC049714 TaxID=3364357 RepID=UPI0037B79C83
MSDRLLLRPWRVDDADFLLELESGRENIGPTGVRTTMTTREDALASIARRALDHPIHGVWAITTAVDGKLVGNLLFKPVHLSAGEPSDGPEDVEIGWHLHPHAQGRGYATEAAQVVIDDAFSRGLTKVIAVTDPGNHASQAVCRRLGMRHLGRTMRYYDCPNELFEKRAPV